jgi:hypothetical protein
MVSSTTEIANLALMKLEEDSIADLGSTDGDRNTVLCQRVYNHNLDLILRARAWGFATKRANIPRSTITPAFEWSYQFELPSDYLYILECNGFSWHLYQQGKFVIENGFILTDDATAKIRYVYRNTNPATYPPDFVEAFACLLAWKLAMAIQGSSERVRQLAIEYRLALGRAGVSNGNESRGHRENRVVESDFNNARYGN